MPAEATLADRARVGSAPALLSGWGGGPATRVSLLRARDETELRAAVAQPRPAGAIARGMGRAYGDAAQLAGGLVLETTRLNRLELNRETGTATVQAGVTIGQLLAETVPAGWVVPVLPGTQHVTVGGAIASDIHGKNHATTGSFGAHVTALRLLTAAGEVLELTPGSDDGRFEATVGGMGLTGVILSAQLALRPVRGPALSVDTDRAVDLDAALALLAEPGEHRVAWLDMLGARPGRGVVTRAEHIEGLSGRTTPKDGGVTVRVRMTVPQRWPAAPLRASTARVFNDLRFRRTPRRERGRLEFLGPHLFPLDRLADWPRLYGRDGLLQYQMAVPRGGETVLTSVIELLSRARIPCFLAVLKGFGEANRAPLSFPLPGWTLSLDLPRAASGIDAALRRCDELVAQGGGRVYLTKDARMRADVAKAMYPRLDEWRAVRDAVDPQRLWRSDLALRTGLVEAPA